MGTAFGGLAGGAFTHADRASAAWRETMQANSTIDSILADKTSPAKQRKDAIKDYAISVIRHYSIFETEQQYAGDNSRVASPGAAKEAYGRAIRLIQRG